jgi:NADH-quinone oxidoreductase subunit G
LRQDHPLFAQRLRQATRKGMRLSVIHATADDLLMPVAHRLIVAPSQLPRALGEVLVALCEARGEPKPAGLEELAPSTSARAMAASLAEGDRKAVLLGNLAAQHPQAALLQGYAARIAELSGASFGFLTEGANGVGGYLAGAWPQGQGLDARAMLASPRLAYVLLHAEPQFDCADPRQALAALRGAAMVVAMTPFRGEAESYATVLLPVSPFTETAGTFVNAEGRAQSFQGVVRPLGETRPAWKVLRALGHMLGYCGFEVDHPEAVRDEALGAPGTDLAPRLGNTLAVRGAPAAAPKGLERIAETPLYFSDALVRRAPALQATGDALTPQASLSGALLESLGASPGERLRATAGAGAAVLKAARDDQLPANTVRVPFGHESTADLGAPEQAIQVERAS